MSKSLLSSKPAKLIIILALVLFVSLPIFRPFEAVMAQSPDQSQNYTREFSWDFGGNHWIWNLNHSSSSPMMLTKQCLTPTEHKMDQLAMT